MATCGFQDCNEQDLSSTLPPGWSLVLIETRTSESSVLEILRRRLLLCPAHTPRVAAICDGSGGPASPDERSVSPVDDQRHL